MKKIANKEQTVCFKIIKTLLRRYTLVFCLFVVVVVVGGRGGPGGRGVCVCLPSFFGRLFSYDRK